MAKMAVIRARCDPPLRDALEEIAALEDVGTSEALRVVVQEAAERRGLWPVIETRVDDRGQDNGSYIDHHTTDGSGGTNVTT